MVDRLLKKYGLLALVILFLVVNIAFSKLKNIILFLASLSATYFVFENKSISVLVAYCITIAYGIITNFHLLENFSSENNKSLIDLIKKYKEDLEKFLKIIPNFKISDEKIKATSLKEHEQNGMKNFELVIETNKIKELIETGHVSEKDFYVIVSKDNFILHGSSFVSHAKKLDKTINVKMVDYTLEELLAYSQSYM